MSLRFCSDKQFSIAVETNKSIAGVLRDLGLIPAGGNYESVKNRIRQLKLDTSHFTGKAWLPKGTEIKTFDNLKHPGTIKKRLIKERGHKCESCGNSEWMQHPIALELDHIYGDRTDNSRESLRLLCPNCHALTPTYRGKNIGEKAKQRKRQKATKLQKLKIVSGIYKKKVKNGVVRVKKIYTCSTCGDQITTKAKTGLCVDCAHKKSRKAIRPKIEDLVSELKNSSFLAISRKYGVSDNAIRKWLRQENIDPKSLQHYQ